MRIETEIIKYCLRYIKAEGYIYQLWDDVQSINKEHRGEVKRRACQQITRRAITHFNITVYTRISSNTLTNYLLILTTGNCRPSLDQLFT